MTVRMLQRRGTASQWNSVGGTVVLQPGEVGVNTTDNSFKIGDGESVWTDLEYHYPDNLNELKYLQLAGGNSVTGNQTITGNVDVTGLLSISIDLDVDGDVAVGGDLVVSGTITSGQINVDGNKIVGLSSPVSDTDAATKGYVDEAIAGLQWKAPAHLLAKTNIALSSSSTDILVIDGHTLDASDNLYGYRVLVTGQSTETENGIYLYSAVAGASYTLSRSSDANDYSDLENASIYVTEGTLYGGSSWVQSNHYLTSFAGQDWVQFNGTQQITDGAGLLKNGNTLSVIGTADRITVTPDNVDIASNYVGQTSINTVSNTTGITTGIWNATKIAVERGGTGATTAEDARINLGLTPVATAIFGTGAEDVARGNHSHDDLYYTESEVDGLLSSKVSTGSSPTLGIITADNYDVVVSSETGNSISLNFSTGTGIHTRNATGNISVSGTGYRSGATKTLIISADSSTRTLSFPSSWIFVGTKPTAISANKTGVLTVTSIGNTESLCIAGWIVQE